MGSSVSSASFGTMSNYPTPVSTSNVPSVPNVPGYSNNISEWLKNPVPVLETCNSRQHNATD